MSEPVIDRDGLAQVIQEMREAAKKWDYNQRDERDVLAWADRLEAALGPVVSPEPSPLACWWCQRSADEAGPFVVNDSRTIAMCGYCADYVATFINPSPSGASR
jgi:hypothetical protein